MIALFCRQERNTEKLFLCQVSSGIIIGLQSLCPGTVYGNAGDLFCSTFKTKNLLRIHIFVASQWTEHRLCIQEAQAPSSALRGPLSTAKCGLKL